MIPDNALIHESVVKKMEAGQGYKPINLPAKYEVVPMPVAPAGSGEQEEE